MLKHSGLKSHSDQKRLINMVNTVKPMREKFHLHSAPLPTHLLTAAAGGKGVAKILTKINCDLQVSLNGVKNMSHNSCQISRDENGRELCLLFFLYVCPEGLFHFSLCKKIFRLLLLPIIAHRFTVRYIGHMTQYATCTDMST